MIDICFVGNSSIDYIMVGKEQYKTYGGSAIYSSLSCRTCSDKNIAIISNVNKELNNLLRHYDIINLGNINDDITTFKLNEKDGSCEELKYYNKPFKFPETININHLHISFRKGVNIESILDNPNIKFQTLSVDVMIHSVEDMLPYIVKYQNKIKYLFCNMKEYFLIKKYINMIPYKIITNEDKPVVAISPNENLCFPIQPKDNIVSSTGAGDTFIGGFLSQYIDGKSINESVSCGIRNSSISLESVGALTHIDKNIDSFNLITPKHLPNNIIVIGNSCSGKTTFINYLKKYYDIYTDVDDLEPLLETFMLDDESLVLSKDQFTKLKDKLKFMDNIYNEYIANYDNINHYTKKAIYGNGHDIIRPILWDMILEKAVSVLHSENNIIQFSRGKDELYEHEFGKNVYKRSIDSILDYLPLKDKTVIVNLISPLTVRKERNAKRYENGGHFVSEDTMDNVYDKDYFSYVETAGSIGYIEVKKQKYPVITICNDKTLSPVELNSFLYYNLERVVNYYNEFNREVEYEFKTNSKRSLAKQIK